MNMGVPAPHDVNSVFKWGGLYHIMHQANWTDWAHLVSTDLAHWTRIQSALSPNGDWDGALTILDGKPIILYDCTNVADCRPPGSVLSGPRGTSSTTVPKLGDPAIVGVARPRNYSDPELKVWDKDASNPIIIRGAGHYAGPSTLWRDGGTTRMLMPNNGAISLISTTDSSLHNWSVTTASFYPNSSGPAEFFALPGAHAKSSGDGVTHMLSGVEPPKPHHAGTAWYSLGQYDPVAGTFSNTTAPAPLDASEVVVFSQLHVDEGRMLFVGWYNPCDSATCHGSLTVPREVVFEPSTVSMRSFPAPELAALRGAILGHHSPTAVGAGNSLALLDQHSDAYDLVLNVSLPGSSAVDFALAIFATNVDDASVLLQLNVSEKRADGARDVQMVGNIGSFGKMQFRVAKEMTSLDVRLLADRTVAEVFVAEGRGVVTLPISSRGNESKTGSWVVAGPKGLTGVEATVWEMGCGWARYP